MKNVLKLDRGARPWSPAADIQVGEVLDEYDIPLSGLLHTGGRTYLFTNILGDGEESGLWAYAHISDDEILAVLRASGPDEFDRAIEQCLADRCVTVAAAFDFELREWTTFDSGREGSRGLTKRFMTRLDRRLKEAEVGVRDLEAKQHLAGAV